MKKAIIIALVIMLCLALSACKRPDDKQGAVNTPEPAKTTEAPATEAPTEAPTEEAAEERIFELSRMITTTVTTGDDPRTVVQGMEYDERGLITFIITGDGETVTREPVSYTFNENGDPAGFVMKIKGKQMTASIENRYEGGELKEAVIGGVTIDGMTAVWDPESTAVVNLYSALIRPVENYTGYVNCTVRVEDSGAELTFEGGKQIKSRMVYSGTIQETITEHPAEGRTLSRQRVYDLQNGESKLINETGMLTDAEGFCLEQTMTVPQTGEELVLRFRYEDSADPDTGAAQKIGYYDEIVIPDSMMANAEEGDMAALEQMKAMPILIYSLDEEGVIVKQEQSQEYMALMGNGSMLSDTSWFENGRIVKHETVFGTMTTTAEYDYR